MWISNCEREHQLHTPKRWREQGFESEAGALCGPPKTGRFRNFFDFSLPVFVYGERFSWIDLDEVG